MSQIYLFPQQQDLGSTHDLLKEKIKQANAEQDLEKIIQEINNLYKQAETGPKKRKVLEQARQRAYEKRHKMRNITNATAKELFPINKQEKQDKKDEQEKPGKQEILAILKILFSCIFSAILFYLVWFQSLEIYRSLGLANHKLVALGANLMALGLSFYSGTSKKKLSRIMCVYLLIYEICLMVAGTIINDKDVNMITEKNRPQFLLVQEKVERNRNAYIQHKTKFEDINSRVFHNNWYKQKYLDPSWEILQASVSEFKQVDIALEGKNSVDAKMLLKIIYRIGLVITFMISIHELGILLMARFSASVK